MENACILHLKLTYVLVQNYQKTTLGVHTGLELEIPLVPQ